MLKKVPNISFNAYKEFSDKELDSQIAALTMECFNMINFEGNLLWFIFKLKPKQYYINI